jgi:protein TonB
MQTALSALREAASQPVAQPVATPVTSSSRNTAGMEKTPATLASRASAGSNGGKAAVNSSQALQTAAAANAPSPGATARKGAPDAEAGSGNGSGSGAAKTGSGDAAASNYTGIVTAHIRRNRRSNLAGAGSVILRIDIAPGGRIDDIDIYRSSGSTRFDRQALRMAKMAAPYPKPPAGQGPVLVRIKGS